jgi:hypothetical protein
MNIILLNEHWVVEDIRKEIKKFVALNANKDTSYQNLWNVPKAVLRGEFVAMSTHIRKLEKSQINNPMLHLKLLLKQEQDSTKK